MSLGQCSCSDVDRTNTLKLRWRDGFSGVAVDCLLCGAEVDTVEHLR